jgi:hypothetical protein
VKDQRGADVANGVSEERRGSAGFDPPQARERTGECGEAGAAEEYGIEAPAGQIEHLGFHRERRAAPDAGHAADDGERGEDGRDEQRGFIASLLHPRGQAFAGSEARGRPQICARDRVRKE